MLLAVRVMNAKAVNQTQTGSSDSYQILQVGSAM